MKKENQYNGMDWLLSLGKYKGFKLVVNNQIKGMKVTAKGYGRTIEFNSWYVYRLSKDILLYRLNWFVKVHKTDNPAIADKYAWNWCENRGLNMKEISAFLFDKVGEKSEIRYRWNLIFRKILFPKDSKINRLKQKIRMKRVKFMQKFHARKRKSL